MSRLKSPVIKILEILVSKASPIESSIVDKMAFVELGGLYKVPMSCILFLIEISTQRHSMFGSSRSCLLFEKKNVITNKKHIFHHDDHLACPF